ALSYLELTRDVQIKNKLTWPKGGVARQVPCLTNRWQRELTEDRGIEWLPWLAPFQRAVIAREAGSIVADVIEISIGPEANVEGRAGSNSNNGRDAQVAHIFWRVARTGNDAPIATIEE